MTSLPNSNSEGRSRNFDQLDPRIQRWVWSAGWKTLREVQERAIPLLLRAGSDVIIAASTASGKTEAALFPILTRLCDRDAEANLVLYVSPLKALINDQWGRLEEVCELLEVPVTPWHGDITSTRKQAFLRRPSGCLLITPESLEAMLMRRGHGLAGLFAGLGYIVVDELHAFMGSERGKQLQSLLNRIEIALNRRVCRVGLSATLGEMAGAQEFLRPNDGTSVEVIEAKEGGQELRVLLKGWEVPATVSGQEPDESAKVAVAADLFRTLRGSSNLVFPNSRREVEFYADRLRQACEAERVPNEFWPHHGNLSKEIREETEQALKQGERPATAICTSTLELGIDIGSVRSVTQIGPAPSVASLRQRLGRSGRRGEAAILRGHVIEDSLTPEATPSDRLRSKLVEMIATIHLLIRGWYEPVSTRGLHASTLVQQLLSLLSQYGGLRASALWDMLVNRGAFATLSRDHFTTLLRHLAAKEIIFQDSTGLILLAPQGERLTDHYSFYAAFSSDEEYRIVADGRTLGSIPVARPLAPGGLVVFGGRRWEVLAVHETDLTIEVRPSIGGSPPSFDGNLGAVVHDGVRAEMREILRSTTPISFLDPSAAGLLEEGRVGYHSLGLETVALRDAGADVHLYLWKGDRIQDTVALMLQSRGLRASNHGIFLEVCRANLDQVRMALESIRENATTDAPAVAADVANKLREKWDHLLPEDVLNVSFASLYLDIEGVQQALVTAGF